MNAKTLPEVGQGATVILPDDRYPYRIAEVSPSGRRIVLEELRTVDCSTGHEPDGKCNGFPVWNHVYTSEEIERFRTGRTTTESIGGEKKLTANLRMDGKYHMRNGVVVVIGQARYYRNYAE